MVQLILEQYAVEPYWVGGAGVILLLVLGLFLASLFRNFRKLIWFYIAVILIGMVYAVYVNWYPILLEALVSYRSDWSLMFLLENVSFFHLLSQLVFYLLIYGLLAIIIVVFSCFWSLVTFRWKRIKIIIERSLSMSWFIFLFSLLTIACSYLLLFFTEASFENLALLFELLAFVFALQFFVRLNDNAYLKTANLFLEYVFAVGLSFLLFYLLALVLLEPQFVARELFFGFLFRFFLSILIVGYMATFLLRAFFASDTFVERYRHRGSSKLLHLYTLVLSKSEKCYSGTRMVLGVLLSVSVGLILLILVLKAWYLVLIPVFFLAYFVLFYLLDQQHDMMVKGDLHENR